MNRPTTSTRGPRVLLAAALAAAAACAMAALPPRPAAAAPAAAPSAAQLLQAEGTGMLGYQLLQIPSGDAELRSVAAIGYDGRAAGLVYDSTVPLVPQPWAWVPGARWQQLEVLDPGTIVHLGGFDGEGSLWGEEMDPATGEAKLLKWVENHGFWSAPLPVLGGDQFRKGAEVTPVSVNRRGDVLIRHDTLHGYSVRHSDGTLSTLSGGIGYQLAPDGGVWGLSDDGQIAHWRKGASAPDVLGVPPGVDHPSLASLHFVGASEDGHVVVEHIGSDAWLRDPDGAYHKLTMPEGGGFSPIGITDGGEIDGPMSRDGGKTLDVLTQAGPRKVWASTLLRAGSTWSFNSSNPAQAIGRAGGFGGFARRDGGEVGFVAMPVDPLVFVHGAGASRLAAYTGQDTPGEDLWLACGHSRMKLSLFIPDIASGDAPPESGAADALRHETCFGASENQNPALNVYGTLLDTLAGSGTYAEYKVEGQRSRQTAAGCDLTQMAKNPNLFVYAYDWRRDNAKSAAGLADYVQCVRQFWPDRKVDVLTHSMGSLVARRYLIDHPRDPVAKLVTIGAPWLGAPKLVDVLETGNFAPLLVNGLPSTIKYVVGSFAAAQQLMASRLYTDQAANVPVFQEDGWDINGDGTANQVYDYATLAKFLDDTVPGKPGTTADAFQSEPGQTDWRDDRSGVWFTSIVGLQAGASTIGSVVATSVLSCDATGDFCSPTHLIREVYVCGDGTVPLVSAQRAGRGNDWNAPDAEVLTFTSPDSGHNQGVEHTGLASNQKVESAIFARLFALTPPSPGDHSRLGMSGADTESCQRTASAPSGQQGLTAAPASARDASDALRYVALLGGTDLTVTSSDGGSTDPQGPTAGWVTGARVDPSDRPDAAQAVLPLDVPTSYRSTFTATGDPIELTLLEGSQQHPTAATRWVDVAADKGTAMELATSADGTDVLKKDSDGDGSPDTVLPPTTRLTGSDALDTAAPAVSGQLVADGDGTHVALAADDGPSGTGVTRIAWSTDGSHFRSYEAPIDVASDATITVFAEDRAGNRSAPKTFAVADLEPAMLTTATLTPAASDAGWSPGAVTVHLAATAPAGTSPVASVHVRTSGAQSTHETVTAGSTAGVTVSAAGSTTVTFGAVAADGTREPDRTIVVRVDLADPSADIAAPTESAVVDDLPALRGTAADDASGVARVEVRLQNAAGRSWDGHAWKDAATWLTTSGSSSWRRTTGLPAGDDLPRGGYRVVLRVTDNAGRVTTTQAVPFTVAPGSVLAVRELSVGGDSEVQTSASAVSVRGVAAGVAEKSGSHLAVRWDAQGMTRLPLPAGSTSSRAAAVDDLGQVWGSASSSTGDRAVRWAADGTAALLSPARPQDTVWTVSAAERTGTWAVGSEGSLGTGERAVRWGPDGPQLLAVPGGWASVSVTGVASDGTAFGTAYPPNSSTTVMRAVSWDLTGTPHLLPQMFQGEATSVAAVSSTGQAVGIEGERSLVRWVDGEVSEVGSDLSARSITPYAIGDDGTVAGQYTATNASVHAFVARPGKSAADLTAQLPFGSGWSLMTAYGLDAHGQVVGFGLHGTAHRAFAVSATHAPVTGDTSATTPEGSQVSVPLDAWDPDAGESLDLAVTSGPDHGTAGIAGSALRYTPRSGFAGTDTITYRATDPSGLTSVPGTVTVTVGDGQVHDRAPVALGGAVSTDAGTPVAVPLSATDEDGDRLTYEVTAQPAHGSLTGTAPALVYEPDAGFAGEDAFTWHASDGTLDSEPATIRVIVNRANHAPEVTLQAPASVAEGGTMALTAPTSDADGDPLVWSWSVDGQVLPDAATNTVAVPAGDGPADHTVSVTVTDGTLAVSRSAVVHVDDLAPVVTVGPAVTTPWGETVALHGQVTDPSAADRAAGLSPTWDLGDGSVAAGTDVTHAWGSPGNYAARLSAVDKDGLSGSATTPVTVTRRPTAVKLTVGGAFGPATASAVVSDGLSGGLLAGRSVVLTVDGTAQPASTTGADGRVSLPVGQLLPGSHAVGVAVAADVRYDAAASGIVTGTVTGSAGHASGGVTTAEGKATFEVNSDGRTSRGKLTWREDGQPSQSVAVTAFSESRDGASAWLGGVTDDGRHRLLAFLVDGAPGRKNLFRIWLDGVERTTTGAVTAGNVLVK